jgi:predicted MPP superfamily phosphohydrolase
MKTMQKRKFIGVLVFFMLWTIGSSVPVTERISLDMLEGESSKVKIVLISDLHSCYYGVDQNEIIRKVDREKPDIVALSGDFFDDKIGDKNAKKTAELLVKKYPVYYVTGNHEYWSGREEEMKSYMRSIGVHVLEGDCETVTINGTVVDICGVDDPAYMTVKEWTDQLDRAAAATDDSHFKLLISHRPERASTYEKYDFDLILTGHAHAGQIRIPFLNKGIFAPDQGLNPEYVSGIYDLSNGSKMEVSRGLARESTPAPRYFNNPEIVSLEVH